ncbi:hypothetical protein [uncultured Pseudonocardia sp.]|uniref:hypothetical protein n=1 Tax=uncultured Pseudonocardia sp. TaxID=211455 RepID=UPI0026018F6A|nr:hypothetical protein [uncultured Pseudonocardia sp.]
MAHRVFFLNKLRPGVDPADYEAWIRATDYPVARASPAILSYDVTRIQGTLDGTGTPSVQYLEVIEVTDIEEYRAVGATPEFVELLEQWATYVELDEALHGTVVE